MKLISRSKFITSLHMTSGLLNKTDADLFSLALDPRRPFFESRI